MNQGSKLQAGFVEQKKSTMYSGKNGHVASKSRAKRLGFILSNKKKRKAIFDIFLQLCGKTGIDLVEIDLDKPLEEQGPFDLIIQKITDYMAAATHGDTSAMKTIQSLELYLGDHPEVIVLDPLDHVRKLCDRTQSYQIMKECEFIDGAIKTFSPNFVQINTMDRKQNLKKIRDAAIKFPVVCKSVIGHGSDISHKMAIIFSEDGLKDIMPPPCVLQQFVNHNATLYKVFVAGNNHYIVQRPSLKNFYTPQGHDRSTIFFTTSEVSKPSSASHLCDLDEHDCEEPVAPDDILVSKVVEKLRDKLNLSLFGIDVLVEKGTQSHAVIDINYFPGYEGALTFPADFVQHVHDLLNISTEMHDHKTLSLLDNCDEKPQQSIVFQ